MATVLGLVLFGSSSNAALIIGSSYSATITPSTSTTYRDEGGDPTAPGGVAWGSSELFDGNTGNVVGWDDNFGLPDITFDLGGLYDVQTIDVWAQNTNGTMSKLAISVSADGSTFSTPQDFTTSWSGSNPAYDTFDVSGLDNAQYVRITPTTNDWAMFKEVEFYGTAVPEPSAALLGGFGALLLLRRRRHASAKLTVV